MRDRVLCSERLESAVRDQPSETDEGMRTSRLRRMRCGGEGTLMMRESVELGCRSGYFGTSS